MRRIPALLLAISLIAVAAVAGQSPVAMPSSKLKWGPAPPSLPPGARMAVMNGDPGKTAAYTIIGTFPDGYVFPPHSHPTDENVVVISGTLLVGMGETYNESALSPLATGSYAFMPHGTRHYGKAKGETTIVVYGTGPFDLAYVQANDDPRKKGK